ncbi:MAG: hypothetical protein HC865_04995 [Cyanobacteria bacterium RU_5_0]|nr:hypothetical protein [Cyanobacteria bacterium RU_5_0]
MLLPLLGKILDLITNPEGETSIASNNELFRLQLAEQIKVANHIKAADQITININLDRSKNENSPKPTALITATTYQEASSTSVLIESQEQSSHLTAQNLPFSSGTHLIIDRADWWSDQGHICLRQIKLIPVLLDQLTSFAGIERPGETLEANVCADGRLIFSSSSDRSIEVVHFDPQKEYDLGGSSKWKFMEYTPDQVIHFTQIPGILLSLVATVAQRAIVLKREHKILPEEYYVLVLGATNIAAQTQ